MSVLARPHQTNTYPVEIAPSHNRKTHTQSNTPASHSANVHIWRPVTNEDSAVTDLLLSILKGLPRPDIQYHHRHKRSFGVTLLDKAHRLNTIEVYKAILPNPTDFLAKNAREVLQPTFNEPLGKIAVKNVIQIGSKHSPTLALEVDSTELRHEMHALAEMCNTLNNTSISPNPIPHISIVKFPNAYGVPKQVVSAVESIAPSELYIGGGRIQTHS